MSASLHRQNIVAVVWDFDKTLIPGYMQGPIFAHFGIDEEHFWREVNTMGAVYRARGTCVSEDILYLNHLLTYVRHGRMPGLNNALLRSLGQKLRFFPGLPELFPALQERVRTHPGQARFGLRLEHYIVSTGLAEMVRGSAIAPYVENVYGNEFIEAPLPPDFDRQAELTLPADATVAQIGTLVDNTIKTRFIFEINKGTNKIASIDVNSKVAHEDRRVPLHNMIYVADGPSDVPVFSVVRKSGGRTYAVYEEGNEQEFAQNDALRAAGRVDHFGRADYRPGSDTCLWLNTHVSQLCDRIVADCERALSQRVGRPPRHIRDDDGTLLKPAPAPQTHAQADIFDN